MNTKSKFDELLKKDFKMEKTIFSYSTYLSLIDYKRSLKQKVSDRFEKCLPEVAFQRVQSILKNDILKPIEIFSSDYFDIEFTYMRVDKNILTSKHYVYVTINDVVKQYNYADFLKLSYYQFKEDLLALDKYQFCFVESKFDRMQVLQMKFI